MATVYDKKTLKQLRALAQERGIDVSGLKKADLVHEHVSFDVNNIPEEEDLTELGNMDEEVQFSTVELPAGKTVVESEQVQLLKLQLEIEQTKLQQLKLASNGSASTVSGNSDVNVISQLKNRLPVMSPDSDIMSFFTNFERCLELNGVFDKDVYARCLPMVLSTRASSIYAQLTFEQAKSYDTCKSFLISTFKHTPEFYLTRLHSMTRSGSDSYSLFLNKLTETQGHYLKSKNLQTFDELKDDCLLNIFMNSLKPEVGEFVRTRQPKSSAEAAAAADLFYSIYGKVSQGSGKGQKSGGSWHKKPFERAPTVTVSQTQEIDSVNKTVSSVHDSALNASDSSARQVQNVTKAAKQIRCFRCNEIGHKSFECARNNKDNLRSLDGTSYQQTAFVQESKPPIGKYVIPVYINGDTRAHVAYRDTGANLSICDVNILDENAYNGNTVEVQGVTGFPVQLRLANILIQAPHFKCENPIEIEVAAMPNLPFGVSLLLGNEMFERNSGRISDVISFHTQDVAFVVDAECRSVSSVNPGLVCAEADDINLNRADAVTRKELFNVNVVNKECIETTAAVVTRRASKAVIDVNGCQQVSSDERTDTSQYGFVHGDKNSSVAVNGTLIGSDVNVGHLATVMDEWNTVNTDEDKRSSVFNSESDLKSPNNFRGETVSDGEQHLISVSVDESLNDRHCIKQSFDGSGAFKYMNNEVRSVNGQIERQNNRVQESRSLLPVRRPAVDTNGSNACIEVNSNETMGRPGLSSLVVENGSVNGTIETESVTDS